MASSLDLANVSFRTKSSEPDRMEILLNNDISRSRITTKRKIGELVLKGGDEQGTFLSGARWYLDEGHFIDHPGHDVRSVILMDGYCRIIHSANQLLALADNLPKMGGGGENHGHDDADAASTDASE